MTSSKISSAPCFVQSVRSSFRNSGRCSSRPLFAGTGSMMTAGLTTLRVLQKEDGWKRLEALGAYLEKCLEGALADGPVKAKLCRLGSMFWIAWLASEAPRSAEALDAGAATVYARVFHSLLDQGIALAPSAFEIAFLSLAHTRRDIDRLAEGLRAALAAANLD